MNKHSLLLFCISFVLINTTVIHGQKSYRGKYKDQLEASARLVEFGYHYTLEKVNKNAYILKQYYPETRQMTHFYTYDSKKCTTLHGLYKEYYDDGALVAQGNFVNDTKEGLWIENQWHQGVYKNGEKEGKWIYIDNQKRIRGISHHENGLRQGLLQVYDSLGIIIRTEEYQNDTIILSKRDTSHLFTDSTQIYIVPRFPGCEDNISEKDKKTCADKKMLQFIYEHIKYPVKARNEGVQGQVNMSFIVEQDGSISNIKSRRGITKGMKDECIRVLKTMPKWIPGKVDGEAVKVQYNLPIRFKLE